MSLEEVLDVTARLGVVLEARGDKLHVVAPRGVVTPELRDALACHKPALLDRLQPAAQYVALRGGLTVPKAALLLVLDLERRGFRLSLDTDQQFHIEPAAGLTEADRAAIHRWRLHLGAIVQYQAPVQ